MKRVARRLLALLPVNTVVPVVAGPLRGRRWVVGSAPHGAWLGTLERPLLEHFMTLLSRDSVVWDIGANVGLYSLAAAAHCKQIVAFEPQPRNVAMFRLWSSIASPTYKSSRRRSALPRASRGRRSRHAPPLHIGA